MDDKSYLCRNRNIPDVVASRSKGLRKKQTPAEDILWDRLRNKKIGYKFRRQHAIGHLILDFYCVELRLGIELDGGIHRQNEIRERDKYKDEFVTGQGVILLRFNNDEIIGDVEGVVDRILQTVQRIKTSLHLSSL